MDNMEILFCKEKGCGSMLMLEEDEKGSIFVKCKKGHKNPLNPSDLARLAKLLGASAYKAKRKPNSVFIL